MAGSRLTVRTLGLATVALILACGHAARAMGQQRGPNDKPIVKAPPAATGKIIRVVPAGSSHSTVATYTSSSGSAAGRTGASRVATFTSKSGSSGNTVVTFSGDKVIRQAATSYASKSAPKVHRGSAPAPSKREPALVSVRKPGDPAPALPPPANAPAPAPEPVRVAQAAPAAATPAQAAPAAETRKPARIRNAFGGLTSSRTTLEAHPRHDSSYAQIQPR